MSNESNVSIEISKDIVNPIVKEKIQQAIIAAMGGQELLIEKVISGILGQKVDATGKVDSYSSYNKYTWAEVMINDHIKNAVKDAMKDILGNIKDKIKEEVIKQLSSKKGIEKFAASLLDQTTKISDRYHSVVTIEFSNIVK